MTKRRKSIQRETGYQRREWSLSTEEALIKRIKKLESLMEIVLENSGAFNSEKKVVIEEKQEVADTGDLGGKETAKTSDGIIIRTSTIKICNCCGDLIDGKFVVCPIDKRVVCPICTSKFNQQKMCVDCLKNTRPLSKPSYKVLLTIRNEIDNLGTIHKLTKMPKDDMKESLRFIRENGYVMRKGLTGYKITETGMNILAAYKSVYSQEEDVVILEMELKKRFDV